VRIPPGTRLDVIEAADPWEEDRELIAMSTFLAVRALRDQGVPKKEIARRLGIDRRTVRKYVRRIDRGETEPKRVLRGPAKLDPFRGVIEEKVASGLSAVQVFQDLGAREDFDASYPTVRRLVQRLRAVEPEVYCRMRFRPGEEAQIDFGEVGRVPDGDRLVRVWLYVMTLCYSRLAYYELVLDQTVPTFLGATARAFGFFGGVPERVKPDNLRAAVLIGQMGERYYQEDFFRFCRHHWHSVCPAGLRLGGSDGQRPGGPGGIAHRH